MVSPLAESDGVIAFETRFTFAARVMIPTGRRDRDVGL